MVVAGTVLRARGWRLLPARESEAPKGFRKVLYDKWYVDEFYGRVVVRPVAATARFFWGVVDTVVIDGTVNLVGGSTRALGWVVSLFQTGSFSTYAFAITLGVLAILGAVVVGG